MKINPKKFTRAAVLFTIIVVAVSLAAGYGAIRLSGHTIVKNSELEKSESKIKSHAKLYEMQDIIKNSYLFDADEQREMDAMSRALAESLDDQYSEYMTEDELKEWETAVNSGFTGIGITFNVTDGRAEILSVAEDGPADAAELRAGDVIKTVNDVEFETEKDFVKAISGKPGKTLKLGMLRGWYAFDADVTIAEVNMRAVTSKVVSKDIGYVRITTFSENSGKEFAAEVKSLTEKKVRGLIIDLRGNGGGYVEQGISICDQILPECTIGYLEDKNGKRETFNSDEASYELPVAVLVNEKTASAAEIVAAAIQDNNAGKIVGTKTYGKGLSQREFKFKDGSALKITTARYLTPSGKAIDSKGIKPDKVVKEGEKEEDGDVQLKKAVALLK